MREHFYQRLGVTRSHTVVLVHFAPEVATRLDRLKSGSTEIFNSRRRSERASTRRHGHGSISEIPFNAIGARQMEIIESTRISHWTCSASVISMTSNTGRIGAQSGSF